jgi:hypothetical protein
MTRDEELILKLEEKTGSVLEKAQEYLTTALPGGPGVFAYVVVSNLVGKLFGNTKEYVESAISRPVSLPNFVYVEPLDEELEEFFDEERFQSLREEFPSSYDDFTDADWMTMRSYYKPLYYSLSYKEPFMTDMFSFEIQSQNYKRIIQDFDLFSLYKEALDSTPSASRQNALWTAVTSILKDTVDEVWNKEYAQDLFEEAKSHPEVAELIENIKSKIEETVDLEQVKELQDTVEYFTGYSLRSLKREAPKAPIRAVDYIANISSDGQIRQIVIPGKTLKELMIDTSSTVQIFVLQKEKN